VISVSQTEDGPVLNLFDGGRMRFDQVDEVVGPIGEDPSPDDDSAPDDGESP